MSFCRQSSQLIEYPADYKRPCPVRPPPRPPMSKCMTFSKPTTAVDGGNHYMSSNTKPAVKVHEALNKTMGFIFIDCYVYVITRNMTHLKGIV